jgi:hypothetical protein
VGLAGDAAARRSTSESIFKRLNGESRRTGLSRRRLVAGALRDWRGTLLRLAEHQLLGASFENYLIQTWDKADLRVSAHLLSRLDMSRTCSVQLLPALSPGASVPGAGRIEFVQRARYLYELASVSVDLDSGAPWATDGWILGDGLLEPSRLRYEPFLRSWRRPPKERLSGMNYVVPVPNNYYHFIAESLPGLLAVRHHYPQAKVLVSDQVSGWIGDLLRHAGIEFSSITSGPIRLDSAVVPSRQAGVPTAEEISRLRSFAEAVSGTQHPRERGSWVYIARDLQFGRVPAWEKNLSQALSQRGVQVISPEQYSVRDQMRLFGKAAGLIGFGGAALTNMVWMREGSKAIVLGEPLPTTEFSPYNWHWARLAAACGIRYEVVPREFLQDAQSAVNSIFGAVSRLDWATERLENDVP